MPLDVLPGFSYPLGATVMDGGVNFSVFSKNCDVVDLLLFDTPDDHEPTHSFRLNPNTNRTFYYWHAFIPGLRAGQLYGFKVHGQNAPRYGNRFDGNKLLLDPYTRAVAFGDNFAREAAILPGDNTPYALKSVVVDPRAYDWGSDAPLKTPYENTVIYEMHVGGFTKHPSSGLPDELRGTYSGVIEKIPYLQSLGITAVELLPVQQFDTQDAPFGLTNYWGYSPIAFFAPHMGYATTNDPLAAVNEFRDMVKALHAAGIEVILDVVFNHTAEGDHNGPTYSYRGLENKAYYILNENPTYYQNYSGCGNTVKVNHSIVRRMIMDCLRHWVTEMHIDGFRFDLASVLARGESGTPLESPPIIWEIESDPVLASTKIIAEAWDAGGLYQVGSFVGHRWAEWNGHFRDDVRRFIKSDADAVGRTVERILGSPDVYDDPERESTRSFNFVTAHDGFTLNDLVSYNEKHNNANGENNRDGNSHTLSWNCGVEGPTDDPAIEALRERQIKNFFTMLFVSQGTPMFLMGDEVRRTQYGNNNAYCQDNEISWFDWRNVEGHAGILRFTQGIIALTQEHIVFQETAYLNEEEPARDTWEASVEWHGVYLNQLDRSHESRTLAFTLRHPNSPENLHIMFNAYWEPLVFELPPDERWFRIVDTALPSPEDLCFPEDAPAIEDGHYTLQGRSAVVLMGGVG